MWLRRCAAARLVAAIGNEDFCEHGLIDRLLLREKKSALAERQKCPRVKIGPVAQDRSIWIRAHASVVCDILASMVSAERSAPQSHSMK
jgi:hypothetical protein